MPGGMALILFGSKILMRIQFVFLRLRMFDPLRFVEHQSWRNILKELKWTVFCDLTSAGTGERGEDWDSCFTEVFRLLERIWFTVLVDGRWRAWFGDPQVFSGCRGIVWYAQRWKSIVRQRHNYFQGNLLTFHHRLHILHMYMYTYTVWI